MFAAIFVPNFSLQAVLRQDSELRSRAVALIDPELAGSQIIESTLIAKRAGVTEGLTPIQATARCATLLIKSRSLRQEKIATEILLQTASAFSAGIEDTALGVCTMDLKGLPVAADRGCCPGNDETQTNPLQIWSDKILQTLAQFHLEAQIGIAPTPELALLAARQNRPVSIVQNANGFLLDLPVAALGPSDEMSGVLARWGVRTAGKFLALGKMEIAERLGPSALELFKRASIHSIRPLKQVSPPEIFSEQIEFENEVETTQPLLFVLRRFAEQLARRLAALYLVVREFRLELRLSSGGKYERAFKIPAPTGNVTTLFRMLQTHLEAVRTDSPIIAVQLTAMPAKPEKHQFGLFESTLRDPNQFTETLARLTALIGAGNIGTPVLEATYKPDSFRLRPPDFDSIPIQRPELKNQNSSVQLRRFRPPWPAHFEFCREKPSLIQSKMFTGPITRTRGPFVSSGNWWDKNRWTREEWDVETFDGSLFRIFRSEEGWFVEGIYD